MPGARKYPPAEPGVYLMELNCFSPSWGFCGISPDYGLKSPLTPLRKLILTHKWGCWTQGAKFYIDNKSKSLLLFKSVIPAEAGIQVFSAGFGFPFSRE